MENEGKQREHACESFPAVFHREMRSEVPLCWQPQGADETPGKGEEKGTTGCVKAQRDQGILDEREIRTVCADETLCVLIK